LDSAENFSNADPFRWSNELLYLINSYSIKILLPIIFKTLFKPLFPITYCPNGDKEDERISTTSEVIEFNESNQGLYDFVSNKTGYPANFGGTMGAFDVIRCGEANGYEIPDWVTNDVYNKMGNVYYKYFEFWTLSELTLRLRGGKSFDY
jgi:hypothetical protein